MSEQANYSSIKLTSSCRFMCNKLFDIQSFESNV